jgi:tetratricopeptide (TPR) repeat protein
MAATETAYRVLQLEEAALAAGDGDRRRLPLRRDLDIGAFGVNAFYQAKAGEPVVNDHDELGPFAGGHEELYLVVKGGCTFTIDGEEVDAPQGTVVFVEPDVKRGSVATEDGTVVVAVGGKRGEAFMLSPYEAIAEFNPAYAAKDYERALAVLNDALGDYPGNPGITYNVACMEALLGRHDDAFAHLRYALENWPRAREHAAGDDDFASLRSNPEFKRLICEP